MSKGCKHDATFNFRTDLQANLASSKAGIQTMLRAVKWNHLSESEISCMASSRLQLVCPSHMCTQILVWSLDKLWGHVMEMSGNGTSMCMIVHVGMWIPTNLATPEPIILQCRCLGFQRQRDAVMFVSDTAMRSPRCPSGELQAAGWVLLLEVVCCIFTSKSHWTLRCWTYMTFPQTPCIKAWPCTAECCVANDDRSNQ